MRTCATFDQGVSLVTANMNDEMLDPKIIEAQLEVPRLQIMKFLLISIIQWIEGFLFLMPRRLKRPLRHFSVRLLELMGWILPPLKVIGVAL